MALSPSLIDVSSSQTPLSAPHLHSSNKKNLHHSAHHQQTHTFCPSHPGVRFFNYGDGRTSHQCRRKIQDALRLRQDKPGRSIFYLKCLSHREKAEEANSLVDWECPKCRGVFSCICCMKKKAYQPTGFVLRTSNATEFNSAFNLPMVSGPEDGRTCHQDTTSHEMKIEDGIPTPNLNPFSSETNGWWWPG